MSAVELVENQRDWLIRQNINMNPTRIELELTEQCNLKCLFCYNSQKPIVSEIAWEIIDRLHEEGVMEVILTGGEPMLHPQFQNLLFRCTELFPKVMIQTNGTLITSDMARSFVERGVFGVNVSLHGPKRMHERLTGIEGSYELAFNGLKNLVDVGINVASNFVLTAENTQYLEETIDGLYSLGLRELTLTRFTPSGIGASNEWLAISSASINHALSIAKQKSDDYGDLRIILANSMPYCALHDNLKSFCECCHFGVSRFYVDVRGDVLMCGMSRIRLGNVLQQSFREIKASSGIYQDHVCGIDVPDTCKSCDNFSQCRGGCRAAAYASTGRIEGPDPHSLY